MSQRIPKALKEAANRIINPDAADKAAADGMTELQVDTIVTLNEIKVSLKMVQKYARRTLKDKEASEKERMNASGLLLKVARDSRQLLSTTISCWQKIGIRPPAAKALRKPPDLSIQSSHTNGNGVGQP